MTSDLMGTDRWVEHSSNQENTCRGLMLQSLHLEGKTYSQLFALSQSPLIPFESNWMETSSIWGVDYPDTQMTMSRTLFCIQVQLILH